VKNSITNVGKGVDPEGDSGEPEACGVELDDVFKSAVSFAYRLSYISSMRRISQERGRSFGLIVSRPEINDVYLG
jgi:hypothetical protein